MELLHQQESEDPLLLAPESAPDGYGRRGRAWPVAALVLSAVLGLTAAARPELFLPYRERRAPGVRSAANGPRQVQLSASSGLRSRALPPASTRAPVVGIVTSPISGPLQFPAVGVSDWSRSAGYDPKMDSYVASSYVAWVRGSGARVAPVVHTLPNDEIRAILRQLNGLLLPGGTGDPSYTHKMRFILEEVAAHNRRGYFLPIWGTCLGFEIMVNWAVNPAIVSGPSSLNASAPGVPSAAESSARVMVDWPAIQTDLRLDFTTEGLSSRMFNEETYPGASTIQRWLATMNISRNDHVHSFPVDRFLANPDISSRFEVLATSNAGMGDFVTLIASKSDWLPFYGVQHHPEKSVAEWNPAAAINHGLEATMANQHFGLFFVEECRRSSQRFDSLDAEARATSGFGGNEQYTGYNATSNLYGFFDAYYFFAYEGDAV